MIAVTFFASGCFLMLLSNVAANGFPECSGGNCVTPYVWYATTVNCTEEICDPTSDCRWSSGSNSRMDEIVYAGRIIAYQLQWFSGSWSDWFVPGMNDRDPKYNTYSIPCSVPYPANGLRKAWAYFYDHTHQVIICR